MATDEVKRPALAEALDLAAHPEGGWFRETWRSPVAFQPEGYDGERATATAIYFLLAPGEESRWHRVRSTELWLWHSGGPLTLELGGTGDAPATPDASAPQDAPATQEVITLGPDVTAGQHPQAVVPAGAWQAARPAQDKPVLVSCIVSPGFDFADFTLL